MLDGTPVFGTLGGFAELMVAWEEQTTGLGLATRRMPVEPGSDVVVLGQGAPEEVTLKS